MTSAGISSVTIIIALIVAFAAAGAFLLYLQMQPRHQRPRRLDFVESSSLGGGRKLILVRRDDVEHLLLVGGPIDLVVETGIRSERASALENVSETPPSGGPSLGGWERFGGANPLAKPAPPTLSEGTPAAKGQLDTIELTAQNEAKAAE